MSVLIACDLDQTLIYSAGALRLPGPDQDAPPMVSVEVIDGRPMSFMTLKACEALTVLSTEVPFVPCTTRTVEQFERVRIPLTEVSDVNYAVASNGGNLLVNGKPDLDWRRDLDAQLAATASPLREVERELKRRSAGDWVLKRRSADGLFCYLVVELSRVPEGFLTEWGRWCAEHGWLLSVQGRKIYSTPLGLRKSSAIAEIGRRLGTSRLIAAGDGMLDAEMLELADAGIRPQHGELAELGWTLPHVEITRNVGVFAGEEIIGWFGKRASG